MLNYINNTINMKIKLFNFFSLIIFAFLVVIFDLNINFKFFPANLILFMSFSNVLLLFFKSETVTSLKNNEVIKDFKALVLSVILISLLSVFLYLLAMFISNKILNIINLAVTFTLLINVMYAAFKVIRMSNLLTVEILK